MKKFLPLVCAFTLLTCLTISAQHTLHYQPFTPDASPTWSYESTWLLTNDVIAPSGAPAAVTGFISGNAQFGTPLSGDIRTYSPRIPVKNHSGLVISAYISYDAVAATKGKSLEVQYRSSRTGDWQTAGETVSLVAGTTGLLLRSIPNVSSDSIEIAICVKSNLPTSGNWLFFVDDIKLLCSEGTAAEIKSLNPAFQPLSNKKVQLNLSNSGSPISQIDFAYTLDGGAITHKLMDFSEPIATGKSLTVRVDVAIPNQKGAYKLKLWVDKINGGNASYSSGSDTIETTLAMYGPEDGYDPRRVLVEMFSSSTCPPCKTMNTYMNPIFANPQYANKLSLIKHQVNFPGSGDPYYTKEVGARVDYYGVQSAPTIVVDGYVFGDNFETYNQFINGMKDFLDADNPKAPIDIDIQKAQYDIQTQLINLKTVISSFAPGVELLVHSAIVEKTTTENKRSNGETEFHNVLMKMLPDANGSLIKLDESGSFTLEFDYAGIYETNVEEINDLQYVVYIFDPSNETYIQSYSIDLTEAVSNQRMQKAAPVTVFPNPCDDHCVLELENLSTVQLYDLNGRLVFEKTQVDGSLQINTQDYNPGVYILRVIEPTLIRDTKLIIR